MEILPYEENVGGEIRLHGFKATTTDFETAKKYMKGEYQQVMF